MLKRKGKLLLLIFICLLLVTGCKKEETDAIKFKKDFESLNDIYSVNISEDNHFVVSSAEDILELISNNKSFVVLFGSSSDYYTRTIMEVLDSSVHAAGLPELYYVDVKSIRDEYTIDENNVITKTKEATSGYNELVKYLNDYLKDYTVINKDNKEVSVGVKKIDTPLLVGVIKSKVSSAVTGVSSLQTSDMKTLSDEIKEDQKNIMHSTINEVIIDLSTCDIHDSGC